MLSQDQWYEKLKSFVPSWVFESEKEQVALFQAMAALLATFDQTTQDHLAETFITDADGEFLDAHGAERSITRLSGELDTNYAPRVQRISSETDLASIKSAIDHILTVPGCEIHEAPSGSPYCSRGDYCSRDEYFSSFQNNFFTVITPKQAHGSYSFCSRGYYGSRSAYAGAEDSSTTIYPTVVALINSMKAFGVMYQIVESTRKVLY